MKSRKYKRSKKSSRKSRKRRKVTRTKKYGRTKSGKGTISVVPRSTSYTTWIGNPVGSDIIGATLKPYIGGTNVDINYVYMSNNVATGARPVTIISILLNTDMDEFKAIFKFMRITSMWVKYTPAITQGQIGAVGTAAVVGGSVAGTLTFMPTNDLDADNLNYPATPAGLHDMKSDKRSTTFSIYKPYFKRWTPKLKVDVADGPSEVTRYLPYNVQLDIDDPIALANLGVMLLSQVPTEAGFQYASVNPFGGGNWPNEGYTAVIGKIEMGASAHFYDPRI